MAFPSAIGGNFSRRTEMLLKIENANARHGEHWRWLLYVALAIAGGLLTFVGARAQQKATEDRAGE